MFLNLNRPGKIAIQTGEASVSFSVLQNLVQERIAAENRQKLSRTCEESGSEKLKGTRNVVLFEMDATTDDFSETGPLTLMARPEVNFVVELLAALETGRPVAVFSPQWSTQELQSFRRKLVESKLRAETALVLFTSGSSGVPKAVELSRQNVLENIDAVISSLSFDMVDSQCLSLPLHYSFGLLAQLLPALKAGATTVLLPGFFQLSRLASQGELTGMLSGVPSHFEGLLRMIEGRDIPERVTHVVSAGARLSGEMRARIRSAFPRATLYNNYGMTECSPRCLSISSQDPEFYGEATGYPVGKMKVGVDDQGELWIEGPQVMLGYLGELDDANFGARNQRLATGDRATINQNGLVTVLGRRDDLVNIGGERLSLDEISLTLKSIPEISDATVIAEDDPMYGAKLVAFYVSNDQRELTHKLLVEFLEPKLSARKIPSEFVRLESISRTESGKLQMQALRNLRANSLHNQ